MSVAEIMLHTWRDGEMRHLAKERAASAATATHRNTAEQQCRIAKPRPDSRRKLERPTEDDGCNTSYESCCRNRVATLGKAKKAKAKTSHLRARCPFGLGEGGGGGNHDNRAPASLADFPEG